MKLTIEDKNRTISIENKTDRIDVVVDDLIIPALLAIGFSQHQIDKFLLGKEDD